MKFTLNTLRKVGRDVDQGWPAYLFGGHVRTSTVALILVFLAVWWIYDSYRPSPQPSNQPPATEVVPPGFVPDPNYTWVPRSRLQQPPTVSTKTVTVTPTPTSTPPTTSSTPIPPPPPFAPPPPFVLPPPFGPPPPPPGASPAPATSP